MGNLFRLGNFIGVVGVVICIISVFDRFIAENLFVQFKAINIFIVGSGLMVFGCFAKLSGR